MPPKEEARAEHSRRLRGVAIGSGSLVGYVPQEHWVFRSHGQPEVEGEIVGVGPIAGDSVSVSNAARRSDTFPKPRTIVGSPSQRGPATRL